MALSTHKHFARAADACGISQPAFSMRIRKLEAELDVEIVRRGHRFQGFTDEGNVVLWWAQKFIDDLNTMSEEVRTAKGSASGLLTIGVVPTALAYASTIPVRIEAAYPDILVRLKSANALKIQQSIEDGSFHAGISYEDGVSRDLFDVEPLYTERYVLVCPASLAPRPSGEATWAEAAEIPLSLLEPEMQNRRILDRVFADIGATPRIVSETNAFSASLILQLQGFAGTIIPEVWIDTLKHGADTVVLPLTDPIVEKDIALISTHRGRSQPTVDALRKTLSDN